MTYSPRSPRSKMRLPVTSAETSPKRSPSWTRAPTTTILIEVEKTLSEEVYALLLSSNGFNTRHTWSEHSLQSTSRKSSIRHGI
ncbi:hypothetical protein Agabi119p4_5039 [Agaricus bisporus var. burnettii]|uniref:Uncharacterized protein n=1 Tax=Agaricus bisporus var. burnettii TaxID=192524 RepID=A0A8H7F4E2_AGABI|nr:hypothetical protein Agabi119p4_5039 [Agaricus bisporus var. burnettii]